MLGKRPTRRQHFIPRLFLKGFAERVSQEFFAYEFRQGTNPQRKNIRQIGFANKFYGHAGLEEKLAIRESDYAALLDALRKDHFSESNKPLIDELISHLLMRTQNLRRGLEEFGNRALARLGQVFEQAEVGGEFHKGIVERMKADPKLQSTVELVPPSKRQAFRLLLDQLAESPELWRATKKQMKQAMSMLDLGKGVRDAQVQALSSEEPYKKRVELLKPFRWAVYLFPPSTFLLGDLGPIGRNETTSEWKHPVTFEGITEVCLPISHECLLVGTTLTPPTRIDPASVNLAAVELSRDFFVARQNSPREREYLSKLGTRSEFVRPDEIDTWVQEGLGKEN